MTLSVFDAAREAPDQLALLTDDARWTFAELASAVRDELRSLAALGVQAGVPIALTPRLDATSFVRLHACIAAGIPMVLLHPRWTDAERERALQETRPSVVLAEDMHGIDGSAGPTIDAIDDPEALLAVLFTSGSSGVPKACALPRRAFVASAAASEALLGWRDEDRWLLSMPLAHVGGLSILTRCLLARRAVVLAPQLDAEHLAEVLRARRVTIASAVPTQLARLLDAGVTAPVALRCLLLGGAAASASLVDRARAAGFPVRTTYGLTEACSQVATQRDANDPGVGPPVPGVEVRTVDGVVHVRGAVLMRGFYPPGAQPDPFDADGWYATGDLGHLDERGCLHLIGRRADRLITGGENVDPVEVERALESLPGVRAACVFGVDDDTWGQRVCAAIVLDAELEPSALDAALARSLAPFKRPRAYAQLDALPQNAAGKLDRRACAVRATPLLRAR